MPITPKALILPILVTDSD